jgi:hypothetical protein
MSDCKKCDQPVQDGQELCHDCSPSNYSCILCGRVLTNGRVASLKLSNPDGAMVCTDHSNEGSQKVFSHAGWTGYSDSTATSRFHKGSAYTNPEGD